MISADVEDLNLAMQVIPGAKQLAVEAPPLSLAIEIAKIVAGTQKTWSRNGFATQSSGSFTCSPINA
jgi:hypothetical protein